MAENDVGQLLIAMLAGLGAFSVLHHLGFGIVYKLLTASLTLVGAFFAYKLVKGESLDSAARDLKTGATKNFRNAKASVKNAYDDARTKTT